MSDPIHVSVVEVVFADEKGCAFGDGGFSMVDFGG